jgi:carboxyl-terminal processing protease
MAAVILAAGCSRDTAEVEAPKPAPEAAAGLSAAARLAVFDALWQTVSEQNLQLAHKQIDWERVKQEFRGSVETAPDQAAFETLLRKAVARLKDGHAYLDFPMDVRHQTAMETMMDGDRVVIRSVVPGSDAEQAGLKPGMELTYIDGEPVATVWEAKRSLLSDSTEYRNRWNAARTILWGLPGTHVSVRAADASGRTVEANLARDRQPTGPRPFEFRTLPGGIFYVRFTTFDEDGLMDRVEGVLKQAAAEQPPGLILDLRGNGGGSHQNGLRIANYLSATPTVWGYVNDREAGVVREFVTRPAEATYRGPVIALTDPSCFSACDLFPAYLQQSGRGTVVGEPPSGATFEATEYPLPHGYTLHLPGNKDLLGPNRTALEGNPAQPDYLAAPTAADWAADRDAALEKAIALLTGS